MRKRASLDYPHALELRVACVTNQLPFRGFSFSVEFVLRRLALDIFYWSTWPGMDGPMENSPVADDFLDRERDVPVFRNTESSHSGFQICGLFLDKTTRDSEGFFTSFSSSFWILVQVGRKFCKKNCSSVFFCRDLPSRRVLASRQPFLRLA
jgi:hypothetical protein